MNHVARILVYDPSDRWSATFPGYFVPFGAPSTVQVDEGDIVQASRHCAAEEFELSHAILLVPPSQGFCKAEHIRIKSNGVRGFTPQQLPVIRLSVEDFEDHSRSGTGFRQIFDDCGHAFAVPAVLMPPDEDELVARTLQIAVQIAKAGKRRVEALRECGALCAVAWKTLMNPSATVTNIDSLGLWSESITKTGELQKELSQARRELNEAAQSELDMLGQWRTLSNDSLARCRARARKVTYHGDGAEEVLRHIIEKVERVRTRLEERWLSAPTISLTKWGCCLREATEKPEVVLPVAGIFSTGKTTFFNHILGPNKEGHPLLRTSRGHNTALLTHFHATETAGSDKVRLTWRDRMNIDLLRVGDPSTRQVVSPCGGKISRVVALKKGWMIEIQSPGGNERVFIGEGRMLEPWVEVGVRVKAGQPISDGTDENSDLSRFTEERSTAASTFRRHATEQVLGFLERDWLNEVTLKVTWLSRKGTKPKFTENALRMGSRGWDEVVQWLRLWTQSFTESEPRILPENDQSRVPIRISIFASISETAKEPKEHLLEKETDWSWFQGSASDDEAGGDRRTGFSEGPEAAWLVARADVHLNCQIFRYVSLIDTPGLASISDQHDQATEACLQASTSFVLMFRVGAPLSSAKNDDLLAMVASALTAHRVPRTEWANRVFVILNWFDRDPGARDPVTARQSIDDFKHRLTSFLGLAHPKLYVVSLKPRKHGEPPAPERLLNEPSLPILLQDLGSFIGHQGIAGRFYDLEKDLEQIWLRESSTMRQRLSDLEAGIEVSQLERLKLILDDIDGGSFHRRQTKEEITKTIKNLLTKWRNFELELKQDLEDKEDFEGLKASGKTAAEQFNGVRAGVLESLEEIFSQGLFQKIAASGLRRSRIRLPHDLIINIPAIAVVSFSNDVSEVIQTWPNKVSRFFSLIFTFEYHGTSRAEDLRKKYLNSPEDGIKGLQKAVLKLLDKEFDEAHEMVSHKFDEAQEQSKDRNKACTDLRAQLKRLEAFEPEVSWMKKRLGEISEKNSNRAKNKGKKVLQRHSNEK